MGHTMVSPFLNFLGQKSPKSTLKEIQCPPTYSLFFQLGGIQHSGICLEISLLIWACVLASTGAWRSLCASKWGEGLEKLVVLHLSEGFLSKTVTKTVTWDVRHITQYLQLFLGQGLRQELDMKLLFPPNTVVKYKEKWKAISGIVGWKLERSKLFKLLLKETIMNTLCGSQILCTIIVTVLECLGALSMEQDLTGLNNFFPWVFTFL